MYRHNLIVSTRQLNKLSASYIQVLILNFTCRKRKKLPAVWRENYGKTAAGGDKRGRGANDNGTEKHGPTGYTKSATTDEEWPDNTVGNGNTDRTMNMETLRPTQPV